LLCTRLVELPLYCWILLFISCAQRLNGIVATLREPQGPEDTPDKLEEERQAAQLFIDTGWLAFFIPPSLIELIRRLV